MFIILLTIELIILNKLYIEMLKINLLNLIP